MKTQDSAGKYEGYIWILGISRDQIDKISGEFSEHPKGIPVKEFKGLVKKVTGSDREDQWSSMDSGTVKANGATYVEQVYGGKVYRILNRKVHEVPGHCGVWLRPKPD